MIASSSRSQDPRSNGRRERSEAQEACLAFHDVRVLKSVGQTGANDSQRQQEEQPCNVRYVFADDELPSGLMGKVHIAVNTHLDGSVAQVMSLSNRVDVEDALLMSSAASHHVGDIPSQQQVPTLIIAAKLHDNPIGAKQNEHQSLADQANDHKPASRNALTAHEHEPRCIASFLAEIEARNSLIRCILDEDTETITPLIRLSSDGSSEGRPVCADQAYPPVASTAATTTTAPASSGVPPSSVRKSVPVATPLRQRIASFGPSPRRQQEFSPPSTPPRIDPCRAMSAGQTQSWDQKHAQLQPAVAQEANFAGSQPKFQSERTALSTHNAQDNDARPAASIPRIGSNTSLSSAHSSPRLNLQFQENDSGTDSLSHSSPTTFALASTSAASSSSADSCSKSAVEKAASVDEDGELIEATGVPQEEQRKPRRLSKTSPTLAASIASASQLLNSAFQFSLGGKSSSK